MSPRLTVGLATTTAILAASTGIAFAAWMEKGPQMLMALAQSGLSWCF